MTFFIFFPFVYWPHELLCQDLFSWDICLILIKLEEMMRSMSVVRAASPVWGLTVWRVLYIHHHVSSSCRPTNVCHIIPILETRKLSLGELEQLTQSTQPGGQSRAQDQTWSSSYELCHTLHLITCNANGLLCSNVCCLPYKFDYWFIL